MRMGRNGVRDGEGFSDYRGVDLDAYRSKRLARFARLIQHLELLPRGLADIDRHAGPESGGRT
jgi:3-hydroxybutyryl-CoA dehydrogenase